MSLLTLTGVTLRERRGGRPELLHDVSLRLDAGELVFVWGLQRGGRSALLRIAAGIEPPERGEVRFAGKALRGGELGEGIGWCQTARGGGGEQREVLDELIAGQLARAIPLAHARVRALDALRRVEASACAPYAIRELDAAEAVRVTIARALVLDPRLLIIDEPTAGADPHQRDGLLALLRSLADDGLTVLAATGDAGALAGADRALALSHGQLRGHALPQLAEVVPLRRRASA